MSRILVKAALAAGAAGVLGSAALAQSAAPTPPPAAQTTPAQTPAAQTPAAQTTPVPVQPAPPATPPAVITSPPVQPIPAQPAQAPAPAGQTLPPVDVIQKKAPAPAPKQQAAPQPKVAPKAAEPVAKASPPPKAQSVAKQAPAQKQAAQPEPPPEVVDVPPAGPNPIYGAANSSGAAARAAQAAQTPVNPTSITPTNLEGFSSSATNVTAEKLAEQQPRNINEVFTKVPGVIVINDDGSGHHGGLAVRGSPARRSRKLLVMEDGHPVNLALWLDPSVHFYAPADRLEGVEVLRGTVVTHGPNNNFGVVNARNLSPFGAPETVISSAIGFTRNTAGFFKETDDDEAGVRVGKTDIDLSARWHVHTRQTSGNFGVVLSYTGENVQGTWDTERLRFHDFYGALGWKGTDQDLVVSASHTRQRDRYDELNLTGQDAEEGGVNGAVEAAFFNLKHCKSCYAPFSSLDTYNGEIWRGQIVHNYHVDKDTTVTSRLYAGLHRRDRYQLISAEVETDGKLTGLNPIIDDDEVIFGEETMYGRLRTFRHMGVETRAEFANRPFIAGMTQTIQTGVRFEHQSMSNRNFLGAEGQILGEGDETGTTIFDRSLSANAVSAFLQTAVKTAPDFTVTPGVRLEWYKVKRRNKVVAGEESEAEEQEPNCTADPVNFPDGCLVIEDIDFNPAKKREATSSVHALPGISFAYTGFYKTTLFGGYHRGLSTAVMRNEDFPTPDEIGDNFELGFRSAALRGLSLEVVGFHQRLKDFQFGASFSDAGDRSFGRADRVEINGVEIAGRLNSQPFTGGPWNVFGEANYTYARGIIKKGQKDADGNGLIEGAEDFSGKHLPEVPFHVAALTVGVEQKTGWGWKWDASATWTYRGSFFTDEDNTPFGGDTEGENGEVPSVWLLSARANLHLGNSGASLFISGDNLLDKLYISDREDGLKPGQGRTIWTGFKVKF